MSMNGAQAAAAVPILNSYAHSYLGLAEDDVLVGGGQRPNGTWMLIVSIGSTVAECPDLETAKAMIDERYDAKRSDRVSGESRDLRRRIWDFSRAARASVVFSGSAGKAGKSELASAAFQFWTDYGDKRRQATVLRPEEAVLMHQLAERLDAATDKMGTEPMTVLMLLMGITGSYAAAFAMSLPTSGDVVDIRESLLALQEQWYEQVFDESVKELTGSIEGRA